MQTSYEEGPPLLFVLLVFSVRSLQRDTFSKVSPIYPNITVDICNDAITVKNRMTVPKNLRTESPYDLRMYLCWLVFLKTQSDLGKKDPQLKNCQIRCPVSEELS